MLHIVLFFSFPVSLTHALSLITSTTHALYSFSELFELVTPQGRPTSPPTATATAPADSQSHLYLAR